MAISRTPWMGSVTLTSSSTAYQLSALLAALSDAVKPLFTTTPTVQYLSIQVDPAAGGAKVYVGNESVSSTNYGVALFASQAFPIWSMGANLAHLDQIWILSDTGSIALGISFITR